LNPTTIVARLALGALIPLASCQPTTPGPGAQPETEPPAEITMVVTDQAFEVPSGIEAEPVSITLENEAEAPHFAFFARLNEGVTPQQVQEAFGKGEEAIFRLITVAGSLPTAEPGGTSEAVIQFPEGSYLVVDPEATGPPPVGFFEVSAASGGEVAVPAADLTIETGEFFFKIDGQPSGAATVQIVNVGKQGHEVVMFEQGADEEGFFSMAPAPGGSLWTTMELQPGTTYQVRCFLPDPKTGKPHEKLGMKTTLEVA
jgi:hypothetical protein